jgi:hypothetical protein
MQASPVNGITTAVQNGRFFPKISVVGGGAQPFSQTTGNLKMELSGGTTCVGQKK